MAIIIIINPLFCLSNTAFEKKKQNYCCNNFGIFKDSIGWEFGHGREELFLSAS